MKIRFMTVGDYEQVYQLWISTPGISLNNLDDSKEGIEKYLKRNPHTCFVAVEDDGAIVGVVMSGHDGRRGFIYHTAVLQKYGKQGIGKCLVDHAVKALEQEGIHKVALLALEDNEAGNGFWEHIGFVRRTDLVYRNKIICELERINTKRR